MQTVGYEGEQPARLGVAVDSGIVDGTAVDARRVAVRSALWGAPSWE
jgi:hypothetical protein